MNININNNSFYGAGNSKLIQKMFQTELTGDRKALVRSTFNKQGDVTGLETIISKKNNRLAGGFGDIQLAPLKSVEILSFYEKLRSQVMDAEKFLSDFIASVKM